MRTRSYLLSVLMIMLGAFAAGQEYRTYPYPSEVTSVEADSTEFESLSLTALYSLDGQTIDLPDTEPNVSSDARQKQVEADIDTNQSTPNIVLDDGEQDFYQWAEDVFWTVFDLDAFVEIVTDSLTDWIVSWFE